MKNPSKRATRTKKFRSGEHIRVVPLHHPKPSISVDNLSRERREREGAGGGLFAGQPLPAPASAKLTYRAGPLIPNVEVFTIFWGKLWGTSASSTDLISMLNKFFGDILISPAVDQLTEYSVPAQTIGHGSFIGTKVITANAPVGSVTDSTIRAQLKKWIVAKTVLTNSKNTLYFIYLDPNIISIMGGSRSCQSYCGYHNNIGKIYYAVVPFPTCSGCLGGLQTFEALTATSSHELCEAITDPVPGGGWYDDINGEIGDICAWNFKQVLGYTVQLEWSNQQNKCV